MAHYEARLERDLEQIRSKLCDLAEAAQTAVETASLALFSGDHELSYGVCLADHPINRASRALDKICLGFIAVHLPSAGHLRFVSSAMHINTELERIGDYAKTISRESVQLTQPPSGMIRGQLEQVSTEACRILEQAVSAFKNSDAEAARAGIRAANEAGRRVHTGFASLVAGEDSATTRELLCTLIILNCFDRVVDQSKNICEETIFAVTGETKAAKSYRVLFLDSDNSLLGPLAAAIAGRNHPISGTYETAGKSAAAAYAEGLDEFLSDRGLNLATPSPRALESVGELSDFHAIVSLQGPVGDYIDTVPFSTIALNWDLAAAEAEQTSAPFEDLYRTLAPQLRDLMVTLHGEETT